jgi:hypothetical protein
MARTLVVLAAMLVGAAAALLVISSMQRPGGSPQDVVLRSFEAMRLADFAMLRSCYSAEAWEVLSGALPAEGDVAARERYRQFTADLSEVRIEAASYRGDRAEVDAVIEHAQGTHRERFLLVRAEDSWLID